MLRGTPAVDDRRVGHVSDQPVAASVLPVLDLLDHMGVKAVAFLHLTEDNIAELQYIMITDRLPHGDVA